VLSRLDTGADGGEIAR